jgi:hypothetical protein
MTADELALAVGEEAAREMASALDRIKHCLGQLSDDQVWCRSAPAQNSIGNLILHLCGNVGQWLVAGLSGRADVRKRPAEFAELGPIPKAELLRSLDKAAHEAQAILRQQTAEQLLRARRIQGRDVTGLEAIFSSVPHFRGHTQEIIHMTRVLAGDAYKFAWKPSTPEEGA